MTIGNHLPADGTNPAPGKIPTNGTPELAPNGDQCLGDLRISETQVHPATPEDIPCAVKCPHFAPQFEIGPCHVGRSSAGSPLHCDTLAALLTAPIQHTTSRGGLHAAAEAMLVVTLPIAGLKCTLHRIAPRMNACAPNAAGICEKWQQNFII